MAAAFLLLVLLPLKIAAEELSEETVTSAINSTSPDDDLARYDQLIARINTTLQDAHEASLQFYVNGLEESYDWKDKWRKAKEDTNHLLADFRATACRIYASDSPHPESLLPIIAAVTNDMYASNQLQDLDVAYEKMLDEDLFKKTTRDNLPENKSLSSGLRSVDGHRTGENRQV
jgi:uncharacterized protein YdhG (YjbR/CyaY superfamily)